MKRLGQIAQKIIAIFTIATLTVGLAGCSKKGTGTSSKNGPPVKLTIWRAGDDSESFQELIKAYQQDHANVTIEYRYNPQWKNNPDLYLQESVNALASGKGPDIWSVRNDWMPGQYEKVRAAPANSLAAYTKDGELAGKPNTEFVDKAFVPVVSGDVTYGGEIYGVPLSVDSLALYTNQTILDQAAEELQKKNKVSNAILPEELTKVKKILSNGPKDWTELIKILPYITTKQGSTITRSAVALGLGDNIEQTPDIISSILLQNNTQIVTDDKKSAFFQNAQQGAAGNSVYPGRSAVQFFTSFATPNHAWYSWNKKDFPGGARQAFLDGKLAMIFEDSTFYATLKASNIKFNFNIITMPQINRDEPKSYANYWVETVTNNSKTSDVAWDFLTFAATTNSVNSYLSNTKRPPALKSKAGKFDEGATQLAVFNGQASIAESWYKGYNPNETDNIFRRWADNIALGSISIIEATNTAAGELTALLQKSTVPAVPSPADTSKTDASLSPEDIKTINQKK